MRGVFNYFDKVHGQKFFEIFINLWSENFTFSNFFARVESKPSSCIYKFWKNTVFLIFAVHFEYPERTFFPEERFYLVPDRTLFHARPDKEVPHTSQGFLKFELPRKFLKWPLNRRTGQLWLFNFLIREKKGFSEIGGHFFRINVVPRSKNLCKE